MRSIESPDPCDEPAAEETPLAGESPPAGAYAGAPPAAALGAPSAGMGVGVVPPPASSGDRAKLGPRAAIAKGETLPHPTADGVRSSDKRGPCMRGPGAPRAGPADRPGESGGGPPGGAARGVGERPTPAAALRAFVTAATSAPTVPLRGPPAEANGAPRESSAPPRTGSSVSAAVDSSAPARGESKPPTEPADEPASEVTAPASEL
jgi:hypothetical protein